MKLLAFESESRWNVTMECDKTMVTRGMGGGEGLGEGMEEEDEVM